MRVAAARDDAARTALACLAAGTTTYSRVRAIVDATDDCDPEIVATTITTRVLRPMPDGSAPSHMTFTRRLRRQVLLFRPDQPRRHADAIARRTCFGVLHDDGTGTLTVTGDTVRIVAALDRVDGLARTLRCHGDARTLDQLRSDIALDLVLVGWPQLSPAAIGVPQPARSAPAAGEDGLASPVTTTAGPPLGHALPVDTTGIEQTDDLCPVDRDEHRNAGWQARERERVAQLQNTVDPPGADLPERPHPDDLVDPDHLRVWFGTPVAPPATVHLVVSLATLLGADDGLAELPGHGDLPAAQARRLALTHGSVWRRLVTDPATGTALELSTQRYRPTAAMADQIFALDNTCRAPGCEVPAARCDLDHTIPWPRGHTTSGNLGSLHRRHHNHKTRGLWRARRDPDGVIHWRVLSGRTYTSHPHDYLDPDLTRPDPPPVAAYGPPPF